jgi:hypothetical protein
VSLQELSLDDLRDEVRGIRGHVSALESRIRLLHQRVSQLAALHDDEERFRDRVERLERVLDAARVAAHLQDAIAAAALEEHPAPHLVVSEPLPPDVHRALLEAVPPAVFFDHPESSRQELRVPLRLAPTHCLVTWSFMTEMLLQQRVTAGLTAPFGESLARFAQTRFPALPPFDAWGVDITVTEGRLVRARRGDAGGEPADRQWDLLTGVLTLVPAPGESADVLTVFLGNAPVHVVAQGDAERCTYEFGLGPSREGRRRLTAMVNG